RVVSFRPCRSHGRSSRPSRPHCCEPCRRARRSAVAVRSGHTNCVWSLAWSPDGNTLASGSGDFTVRLWDTRPLETRCQARREAESLRPQVERLVDRLSRRSRCRHGRDLALQLLRLGTPSPPLSVVRVTGHEYVRPNHTVTTTLPICWFDSR